MIQIYHNTRCSKSRCALDELEKSGQEFEVIYYLETPTTKTELTALLKKLGIPPIDLIRKTESIYINKYKGKQLSNDEWIIAMVENPILMQRPIIVSGDKAVIARSTETINDILQ